MNVEKLNEVLSDLEGFRNSNVAVHTDVANEIDNSYGEGIQGEEGLSFEVFETDGLDGYFVKLEIRTDSYGDNERISGVQFVKPKEKTVVVYEF